MQSIGFVWWLLLGCIYCFAMPQKGNQQTQEGTRIGLNEFDPLQCDLTQFIRIGSSYVTMKGTKKQKAQQICDNIPIFGAFIVIESDENGSNAIPCSGLFYECNEIKLDLLKSNSKINSEQAIQSVISPQSTSTITSQTAKLYIYIAQNNGWVYLAWIIDITGKSNNFDYSWFAIVDSESGNILMKIDTLQRIKVWEVGGNEKMGAINHVFDVPSYPQLRNENVTVKNYNTKEIIQCTSSADCVNDEVNGGFSPAGDVFKFGNDVFGLYNDWFFGSTPLNPKLIPVNISVYLNFNNAVWFGREAIFGNGISTIHPYTALGIVAHELAHGFTDWTSALLYQSESGGMSESYSDLAGIAAVAYVREYAHWRIGFDFYVQPDSLRYLYDPPIDGRSVDQWDIHVGDLNVHYSSGVYNKFFYLLYSYGWSVKQIFQIVTKANQIYWLPFETMNNGACGVLQATIDLFGEIEYMLNDIKQAFKTVNIVCESFGEFNLVEKHTDLSAVDTPITGQYNHTNTLQLLFATRVSPNNTADADLRVRYGEPPTFTVWDCASGRVDSNETCRLTTTKVGIYYWMINPFTPFSDLNFTVSEGPESESKVVETHTNLSYDGTEIPRGQYNNTDNGFLQIMISGGTGDADLYVKFAEPPTLTVWDCRPFRSGNEESCTFSIGTSTLPLHIGIYHWMVNPYRNISFSGVDLSIIKGLPRVFEEFEECTFEPLYIEDKSMWETLVYNEGHPWLMFPKAKAWISSYELSRRSIDIPINKFCSVSDPRYLTITGRASGSGPNQCDTYRLMVQFKNDNGYVLHTFDTGFVETMSYFKEYIASYDNYNNNVSIITIFEWGDDAENNKLSYFGTVLKLPTIHISNNKNCFIGYLCSSTNDCCPHYIDEKEMGVKCHRKHKTCCLKDGNYGCLKDEDCCSQGSLCFDGVCKSWRQAKNT